MSWICSPIHTVCNELSNLFDLPLLPTDRGDPNLGKGEGCAEGQFGRVSCESSGVKSCGGRDVDSISLNGIRGPVGHHHYEQSMGKEELVVRKSEERSGSIDQSVSRFQGAVELYVKEKEAGGCTSALLLWLLPF